MVIQNLPRSVRFKPENLVFISCIPGPKEPKKTINSYLQQLCDEFLKLWDGAWMNCVDVPIGLICVRAALSFISCDLPAICKVCGFFGCHATHGCSKCFKAFPVNKFGDKPNYAGFDKDNWTAHTHKAHIDTVSKAAKATSLKERHKIECDSGMRYSELLKLPYLNIVQHHLIDPMHNLFLGTAKNSLEVWKSLGLLTVDQMRKIQDIVDLLVLPPYSGRIPSKIGSGFAEMTAEQWKMWTLVYSPFILQRILPREHFNVLNFFIEACALICHPCITVEEVVTANRSFIEYGNQFQRLYGESACTPNMHMHCHLQECILDVGLIYSFWCFSF